MYIEEILREYSLIKNRIEERIREFNLNKNEEEIFAELVFCLLTPQSKAKTCWNAVINLVKKGLLLNGNEEEMVKELKGIRFRYKKARYIVAARNKFMRNNKLVIKEIIGKLRKKFNLIELREWLVKNIKGIGYKEASHFLRNIGMGGNFAILDRHILKNLKLLGIIKNIPIITRKKYIEIENKLRKFSQEIKIPLNHLDLLLWYKETGEIFK